MEETTDQNKLQEKPGWQRTVLSYLIFSVWLLLTSSLSNYFNFGYGVYIFYFCSFLIYFNIEFLISGKNKSGFNALLKVNLKLSLILIIVGSVLYNVIHLTDSFAGLIPEDITRMLVTLFSYALVAVLIGYGVYSIRKTIKL